MPELDRQDILDFKVPERISRAPHSVRPRASVVSISTDIAPSIRRSFADRVARWEHTAVELILVCIGHQTAQTLVTAVSGQARLIYGPPHATETQLIALGFAAAIGDVVILVDDPAIADARWVDHVSITGTPPSRKRGP